jgi:hypothetical protein
MLLVVTEQLPVEFKRVRRLQIALSDSSEIQMRAEGGDIQSAYIVKACRTHCSSEPRNLHVSARSMLLHTTSLLYGKQDSRARFFVSQIPIRQ